MIEQLVGFLALALLSVAPAIIVATAPPTHRLVCAVLSAIALLGGWHLANIGPDSPVGIFLLLIGFGGLVGAGARQVLSLLRQRGRGRNMNHG